MGSVDVARNQAQKIVTLPINERKLNESPAEFYTCPTDKKATLIGSCLCTGLGAASEVRLVAAGVPVLRYNAADVSAIVSKPFDIQLAAGETLAKAQNSGTNGELDLNCKVQETPI